MSTVPNNALREFAQAIVAARDATDLPIPPDLDKLVSCNPLSVSDLARGYLRLCDQLLTLPDHYQCAACGAVKHIDDMIIPSDHRKCDDLVCDERCAEDWHNKDQE